LRANHIREGEDEAITMPTQVQVNSQILLSAHKPQQRGLGPCTDLDLQFQPHPKPLRCVNFLLWEGSKRFNHEKEVKPIASIS